MRGEAVNRERDGPTGDRRSTRAPKRSRAGSGGSLGGEQNPRKEQAGQLVATHRRTPPDSSVDQIPEAGRCARRARHGRGGNDGAARTERTRGAPGGPSHEASSPPRRTREGRARAEGRAARERSRVVWLRPPAGPRGRERRTEDLVSPIRSDPCGRDVREGLHTRARNPVRDGPRGSAARATRPVDRASPNSRIRATGFGGRRERPGEDTPRPIRWWRAKPRWRRRRHGANRPPIRLAGAGGAKPTPWTRVRGTGDERQEGRGRREADPLPTRIKPSKGMHEGEPTPGPGWTSLRKEGGAPTNDVGPTS